MMSKILGDPFLQNFISGQDFDQRVYEVQVFLVGHERQSGNCVRVETHTLRYYGCLNFRLRSLFFRLLRRDVIAFVIRISFLLNWR